MSAFDAAGVRRHLPGMHDRLIPFDRILNFRDFGGWDTVDGARVARGKLFRSASFHEATDADVEKLNAMDLRFLVDLRRPEERSHEPASGRMKAAASSSMTRAQRVLRFRRILLCCCKAISARKQRAPT